MEILTNVEGLVAFVARLPEAELSRKDNSAIRVFAGLELCEKLCGDGRLGLDSSVRRAAIDHNKVPVGCWITLLLCLHASTRPELCIVEVFTAAIKYYHNVGVGDLSEDASHVLHWVEGLGSVIEYKLCCIILHAAMTSVVDEEECLGLPFAVGKELHSITIQKGLNCVMVNIFLCMNLKGTKAKLS